MGRNFSLNKSKIIFEILIFQSCLYKFMKQINKLFRIIENPFKLFLAQDKQKNLYKNGLSRLVNPTTKFARMLK